MVTDAVRKSKHEFFIQSARSGGKYFWANIKQCTDLGRIKNLATPWPCHNSAASLASANKLNNNFIYAVAKLILSCLSIANTTVFEGLSGNKHVSYKNSFSLLKVTVKDVKCIIDLLPHSAVAGQGQISAAMLKKSPIAMFEALSFIFIESLSTGIFLEVWKSAIIEPVHKKGDIYCLDNYRPISVLSTASKVFERFVNIQL